MPRLQLLPSYYLPEQYSVSRRQQGVPGRPEGPCPSAAKDFNLYTSGCDTGDALWSRHSVHRPSKKWWKGFCFYSIDQSTIATYRIWKLMSSDDARNQQSSFREMLYCLCKELRGASASAASHYPPERCGARYYQDSPVDPRRFRGNMHLH